MTSTPGAPSA